MDLFDKKSNDIGYIWVTNITSNSYESETPDPLLL